jgi:hypothetical protein
VRDHVGVYALAPLLELVDGGGAEGVGGSDYDVSAVAAIGVGELGDAGRLAGAVDADHKHDGRPWGLGAGIALAVEPEAAPWLDPFQDGNELFLEDGTYEGRLPYALLLHALLETRQDVLSRADTDVGADEQLLQLEPEVVVDAGALEEAGDAAEPGATRPLQRFGRERWRRSFDRPRRELSRTLRSTGCGRLSRAGFLGLVSGLGGATEQANQGVPPILQAILASGQKGVKESCALRHVG